MMLSKKSNALNKARPVRFCIKLYLLFLIYTTPKLCTGSFLSILRDLKPENMMYDKETKIVKLIDFGTAVRFDSSDPIPRRCVGTV